MTITITKQKQSPTLWTCCKSCLVSAVRCWTLAVEARVMDVLSFCSMWVDPRLIVNFAPEKYLADVIPVIYSGQQVHYQLGGGQFFISEFIYFTLFGEGNYTNIFVLTRLDRGSLNSISCLPKCN